MLHIANEEVMAIGDNHNDVEMLQMAVWSIMANAEPTLKEMGFTKPHQMMKTELPSNRAICA